MASNESKIPVGTILVGKYRVVREIGRGGMAAVYEAEQLSLGKKVAVKVLNAELSASTIVIERFFREARAAASVKSPYIVDVYDSGRLDDGRPFIAMELLEGESLYDRMARVRIIDIETTMRVVVHTARGLVKAHAAGIVHRDLKPENIFLTKGEDGDDICKILDFGLAKFYAPVKDDEKAQKRLTREGAVFGTPAYMSPEQVKGQGNVDHRADLWALGCMAYECLIGRPVWNMDQGVAMTFASIAAGPIPVPSKLRQDLPPAFDAWFKKCLERDPNRRFQAAKELSDAYVEAWGQRPHSSASFPKTAPGPGLVPQLSATGGGPAVGGGLEAVVGAPPSSRRHVAEGMSNGEGVHGSAPSVPLPLLNRASGDVPPTSDTETPVPPTRVSPVRMAISAAALAAALSTAIFVWLRFLSPQVFAPVVQSTATVVPSAQPSGTPALSPEIDEPEWAPIVAEGQKLYAAGNYADARTKFEEVVGLGGLASRVGGLYIEQTKVAEKAKGSCRPAAFSRPRLSNERRAERPSIVTTSKGALVVWMDDHEQDRREHVYGTLLDAVGTPIAPVRDLTPEATSANRPQLASLGMDRVVLLYWDEKGKEAGVRARMLDADGRIDKNTGQSVLVGAARSGQFWPAIDKGPQAFHVVWQDDRDKDGDYDLFTRRLSFDLETIGPETRLTDYNAPPKSKGGPPRVRYPTVALAANTLIAAYRLEHDKEKLVVRMRVPLGDLDRGGLEESKDPNRTSRELGDVSLVSEDKAPGDAPAVACGPEGCFIVWHRENGGAFAAMMDPKEGRVIWRKRFAGKGGRPSLGVNEGRVAVAYYESNYLKMAMLSGDGVGKPSTLYRVHDDKNGPRPTISAGANQSEWNVSWQDSDVPRGQGEVYAGRIVCR